MHGPVHGDPGRSSPRRGVHRARSIVGAVLVTTAILLAWSGGHAGAEPDDGLGPVTTNPSGPDDGLGTLPGPARVADTVDDGASTSTLPPVVGELLEMRLQAQTAITGAELARTVALQARERANAAGFAATLARLRARHHQHALDRWAAGLYRNEIGIGQFVDIAETSIIEPERVVDVATWLEIVGRDQGRDVEDARRALRKAEDLERIADEALARAEEAERDADVNRAEADALLASTETALRGIVGDDFKYQLTIGPDGCPTEAPEGTVRGTARPENVGMLCARSIALAPTPEAALAIKYAFRVLGADYACSGIGRELPMRYDCSSLVARSYAEGAGLLTATATWIPTTRNLLPWGGMPQAPWSRNIEPADALPGDLVLYDTEHLDSRHVVLVLADGYMLHIAECGDVANVTNFWGFKDGDGYTYLGTRRVDPALANDISSGPWIDPEGYWLADAVGEVTDTPSEDVPGGEMGQTAETADGEEDTGFGVPDPGVGGASSPAENGPDHETARHIRRNAELEATRQVRTPVRR